MKQTALIVIAVQFFLLCSFASSQTINEDWGRKVQGMKSPQEFATAMQSLNQALVASPRDETLYNIKMRLCSTVAYPRDYKAVISTGETALQHGLKVDHNLMCKAFLELGNYAKAREQIQLLEKTSSNKLAPVTALADYIRGIPKDPSFNVELQRLESYAVNLAKLKGTAPTRASVVATLMWVGAELPARRFLPQTMQDSEATGWTKRQFANEVMIPQGDYSGAREWLGKAVASGDDKAEWDLARLLVRKGDFTMAEPLLRKASTELDGGSLFLQSVHQYPIRGALARILAHQGDLNSAKHLLSSSPALQTAEEETLWYLQTILWPRLQMAAATKDSTLIKETGEHLYKALAKRRAATGGRNDVEAELLGDLLQSLHSCGHKETAQALAVDTLKQVADTRLPYHKAARAQAHQVLGQVDQAKQAWAEASTLAPADIWIRKSLEHNIQEGIGNATPVSQ